MSPDAPKAPHLAKLLSQNVDEITEVWAQKTHEIPGSRYSEHALEEIRSWLSRETESTVTTLTTGSYEATEAYLRGVAESTLEAGFRISEVIESLMLFREAVRPIIYRAYEHDDEQLVQAFAALNAYLRFKVGRFGYLFAQAADERLRSSEERFRTVADFAYDWEYWVDAEGQYVYVSPSCERVTGYSANDFQTDPGLMEHIVHPRDLEIAVEHIRLESQEESQLPPLEFRVVARDGTERWIEHVCRPVYDSGGKYLGRRGSNRDVTERKRVEQELEQYVRDKAAAEERSRLARELHDSVTQALYSINLHAEAANLALSAGNQDVVAASLQKLKTMIREAMMDLRMLIFELRPPILQEEGLVAALRSRLASVETRAGLQSEIWVDGEENLPLPIAEELFWIGVEAFNNVLKHAEAKKVTVNLVFTDSNVTMTIADDGIGFDRHGPRTRSGMGLRSIAERVEHIGGTLGIDTAPGQGARLQVSTPL